MFERGGRAGSAGATGPAVCWPSPTRNAARSIATASRVAKPTAQHGLSTAAAGYRYTAAEHVTVVERVVERLDLQNIVLMVHDWGGPIGFAAASRAPHRYAGFVIGNSWAWPIGSNQRLAMFSQLMGGPVGRLLIRDANVFITPFVRSGHTRHKPTKADMVHWRAPFPDRASREHGGDVMRTQ